MRPASTTNLSFHSSSDGSGLSHAAYERLGTDSTALGSWNAQSFATARSEAAPTTGRSCFSNAAAAGTSASPAKVPAPDLYPTESPKVNRGSPRPPPAVPGAKMAGDPGDGGRGAPTLSYSMGTLPPAAEDRLSPPGDRSTGTVTPVTRSPFYTASQPRPQLPLLRLPESVPRSTTVPPLQAHVSSPLASSSSMSKLSSGDALARKVDLPLMPPASPLAGKPAARQVSFSQSRSGDKHRGALDNALTAPLNTMDIATFGKSTTDSVDARRNSGSTTIAGASSPPRRRASLSSTYVQIPTRRYTITPDAGLDVCPTGVGGNPAEPLGTTASGEPSLPAAAVTSSSTAPTDVVQAPHAKQSNTSSDDTKTDADASSGGLWGWYEAAKKGVYTRADRIKGYLDGLIDPIGGGSGTRDVSALSSLDTGSAEGEPSVLDAIKGVPPPRRYGILHGSAEDHQPFGGDEQQGAARRLVEQVFLEDLHEPITTQGRMAHVVDLDSVDLDDGEATDVDAEQPTFEIDLISAFHGYRNNPSECFGHLVAAALTSRSEERPVTGLEIREAGRHPYLVRLVLSYSWLDYEDPIATEEVQATLDLVLNEDDPDISPALYEYLVVFFQPPFIRLSHRQYTILKQSGFEYVVLLYHHRHVLPPERFHSIVFNYSTPMRIVNLVFMLFSSAAMVVQNVAMLLVLANWMTEEGNNHQRFGFFTLIVYGCGYAVNLVMLIFFMRTRQDTFLFDNSADPTSRTDTPTPYVLVVPVLPIFDVLCVVQFARAWKNDRLVAMHNVLVSSRLSAVCFSIVFSMAQLIAQSYFYHTLKSPDYDLKTDWHYAFLVVTSVAQWGIAVLRFAWMMLSYDSINGVGFTRFRIPYQHTSVERHSGVVHVLHYLMVFVLENDVYLLVASALTRGDYPGCVFLPNVVISLASVSIMYALVIFAILIFSSLPPAKISFTCVPLALLQAALFVVTIIRYRPECVAYERRVMRGAFVFGYILWCAYIFAFIIWLLWVVWWIAFRFYNTNLFPRLNHPWKRKTRTGDETVKSVEPSQSAEQDGGGELTAPADTDA